MKAFSNALIASFCIQTAVLAGYVHYPFAAEFLLMMAGGLVFNGVRAAGGGVPRRTARRLRDALATLLLLSGLLRFVITHGGGGDIAGPPGPKPSSKVSKKSDENKASVDNSGDHTGVILLPERQPNITLVPPLPSMPSDLFDAKHQTPLTIPFYGAYWFFKLPDTKPPLDSLVTHGTPAETTFFAPDSRPLMMEAHQNLGKLIDIACCREIRIEIRNADRYPGTVSMELILVNTREGQEGSVSLGAAPVTSAPADPGAPMKETLTYLISKHGIIRKFDELMIRFPRQRTRINRSAKIAIDRFILIPRS